MKTKNLKEKSTEELIKLKGELLKEQFNLRMQKGTGQLEKTHQIREGKRCIARINTLLNSQ